ncbi:glycosyltransferase [Chloroflexota bacterium]
MKKVLFISGSLGLGHVTRDLIIAKELRKEFEEIDIQWLAAEPARSVIERAGGVLVDEIDLLGNDTAQAEATAQGTKLNLLKYAFKALREWLHNADVVKLILEHNQYDLIIGDETYEIAVAIILRRLKLRVPFIMLYDFFGLDAMSKNIFEKIGMFLWNRIWSLDYTIFKHQNNLALFIGELEDIPDTKLGLFLPNRREYASKHYNFVGYILPFESSDLSDTGAIRKKLGYGDYPLVICSIGGTAIGHNLLTLCGKAYFIVKQSIPDLHMVLVCGPRLSIESLDLPQDDNLEIKQYVPELYEHFAACDLAIVQAGATTTLELTALKIPFIYFPIEGHSEQEIVVAGRLQRYGAGVKMSYSQSNEYSLAEAIMENINSSVDYHEIPSNGAKNIIQFVKQIISK